MKKETLLNAITIIKLNKKELRMLGVVKISLFGSILTHNFTKKSDVDILLIPHITISKEDYKDFKKDVYNYLQPLFNRRIEIYIEEEIKREFIIEILQESIIL